MTQEIPDRGISQSDIVNASYGRLIDGFSALDAGNAFGQFAINEAVTSEADLAGPINEPIREVPVERGPIELFVFKAARAIFFRR